MTETQVFELMKHQSGGMLAVDRFGFITRQASDQVGDKVQLCCMAAARAVFRVVGNSVDSMSRQRLGCRSQRL
jgi:hypothetical protein